jgi:hypothetical protein
MTVKAVQLSDNPAIIHMQFSEPFDGQTDLAEANKRTQEIMKKVGGYVCRIEDVRNINLSFDKLTAGLAKASEKVTGSMSDPNVYSMMVGNKDDLSEFTASSFAQKQYGGKDTPFFTDINEAIAHAREHMNNR